MSKHTWVIGGTSGIGEATTEWLRDTGRFVTSTGIMEADVCEPRDMELAWEEFESRLKSFPQGKSEIVYCAGINKLQSIQNIDNDTLLDLFDVNVFGFVRLLGMLREKRVTDIRIVAVSSDAAVRPMRTSLAYCASKAALNMAVRVAARELAEYGYRINAVAPGMTADTGMSKYIDETVPRLRGWSEIDARQYELQQQVIKRRAQPLEIAMAIEMILEAPDYMNGEIVTINGGR